MEIITQESLAENFIESILAPLREQWRESASLLDFDEWCWNNLSDLGEALYTAIGEFYGGAIE